MYICIYVTSDFICIYDTKEFITSDATFCVQGDSLRVLQGPRRVLQRSFLKGTLAFYDVKTCAYFLVLILLYFLGSHF